MIETIFNDTIYTIDSDCMITQQDCLLHSKDNDNNIRSNAGGYHSTNRLGVFPQLEKFITNHAKTYASQLGLKDNLRMNEIWININDYKDHNKAHTHPGSCLSGVYYVHTPRNCGNISFLREGYKLQEVYWSEYIQNYKKENWAEFTIPVRSGLLVIFPSFMEHRVESNMNEKEPRMSVAFNLSK